MQVVRWLHCRRLTLLAAISSLDTKSHGEDIWRALGVECPQVLLLRLTRTTSGTTTLLNAYLAFPAMTSHPDSWEVSPPGDFYTFHLLRSPALENCRDKSVTDNLELYSPARLDGSD